jgi:hypothetical protein
LRATGFISDKRSIEGLKFAAEYSLRPSVETAVMRNDNKYVFPLGKAKQDGAKK